MEMMKQLQGLFCLGVCRRHIGSNGEEKDTLSIVLIEDHVW